MDEANRTLKGSQAVYLDLSGVGGSGLAFEPISKVDKSQLLREQFIAKRTRSKDTERSSSTNIGLMQSSSRIDTKREEYATSPTNSKKRRGTRFMSGTPCRQNMPEVQLPILPSSATTSTEMSMTQKKKKITRVERFLNKSAVTRDRSAQPSSPSPKS